MRLFELYSSGQHTFESIGQKLADEGFTSQKTHPKFHRTAVSYMLNNRHGRIKAVGVAVVR